MSADTLGALELSIRVAVFATLLNALLGNPARVPPGAAHVPRARALVDLLVTLPLVAAADRHRLLPHRPAGTAGLARRAGVRARPGWSVAFTWYAAVIAATVMALPLLVTHRARGHRVGRPRAREGRLHARPLGVA